jgi:ribosomal protein S18 acetylase RimI-like enzyme
LIILREQKMFKIRPAIESDARQISKVHIDSWRAIYRGHMPDSILDNLSLEKREREWQERLLAGINTWVIEDNQKIVGFASICPTRDSDADPTCVAEISAIYLLPDVWQKGLGKKLCETIFESVIKKGFKEITLWVLERNAQARQFYEAVGFQITGDIQIDHVGCENLQVVRYKKVF